MSKRERELLLKQLARVNGIINQMSLEDVQNELMKHKLNPNGAKEVLVQRLKNFKRCQTFQGTAINDVISNKSDFRCLCVIDFEATCKEKNEDNYMHEIIEFPAVVIDVKERKVVGEFHSYCKPSVNPSLTDFCQELTGITQDLVDTASPFSTVLDKFLLWLREHEITHGCKVGLVTHGAWDFGKFLFLQSAIDKTEYPKRCKQWINIKKTFTNFYKCRKVTVDDMLEQQGLKFEGRQHKGLDDARNIARVIITMLEDGAHFRINEKIEVYRNEDDELKSKVLPVSSADQYGNRGRMSHRSNQAKKEAGMMSNYPVLPINHQATVVSYPATLVVSNNPAPVEHATNGTKTSYSQALSLAKQSKPVANKNGWTEETKAGNHLTPDDVVKRLEMQQRVDRRQPREVRDIQYDPNEWCTVSKTKYRPRKDY